jgi:vancomycin resistance protein YoaR
MSFPRVPGAALAGVLSLAVAAGTAAGVFFLRDHLRAGKALPGVRVAEAHLTEPVAIAAAGSRFTIHPGAVVRVDEEATRRAALAAGRDSTLHRAEALLLPMPPRRGVEPVLRLRPPAWQTLLARLDALGRRPRAATVVMHGLEPVVRPGRPGTRVDRRALVAALLRHVRTGHSAIRVRYVALPPKVDAAVARRAAATARTLVSAPVELRYHGRRAGALAPDELAPLVRFLRYRDAYVVQLAAKPLGALVAPLVRRWTRAPRDATFDVASGRPRVVPSQDGLGVDAEASAAAVTAAARGAAGRTATLALVPLRPALTTAEARSLGIRRKLVSYTTDMGPSSANRILNVHLLADYAAGTIVRSGHVFSFNRAVGPRTRARGFVEGGEIVGTLTIPSIGGGVCQTATTLFNDAFQLGLPIVERHNHGFYIAHYPLGRDATVAWDGPDLKFRNDLEHAILITTSYTDQTLTFTFWGTPQGRRIVATTGPKTNWTGPRMAYAVDPQAPPGSRQVVQGSGEQGFDVTVARSVYEHGRLLRRDAFASHYVPVGPTTVYGPGTTPPGPYVVLPPH